MVSRAVEKAVFKKYKGRCAICKEKTPFDKGEVDHIKPKANGGTNNLGNLQWLCPNCNKLKGHTNTNREVRKLLGLKTNFHYAIRAFFILVFSVVLLDYFAIFNTSGLISNGFVCLCNTCAQNLIP